LHLLNRLLGEALCRGRSPSQYNAAFIHECSKLL
jgi:hypothetical protein